MSRGQGALTAGQGTVRITRLRGSPAENGVARLIGWPGRGRLGMSHPVLEGKPNANHVRTMISNSRTQQLHNMEIITQCSNSIKKRNNSRLHHMSETST
jgi:hypothetical protein